MTTQSESLQENRNAAAVEILYGEYWSPGKGMLKQLTLADSLFALAGAAIAALNRLLARREKCITAPFGKIIST